MVTIRVRRKKATNGVRSFEASGHAQFAPMGWDIVCAAVSAITQTAGLGVHSEIGDFAQIKDEDGLYAVDISQMDWKVRQILDTMVIGLRAIEEQYPEFVQVVEEIEEEEEDADDYP